MKIQTQAVERKSIYYFLPGQVIKEAGRMQNLLGNKGAYLAEMTSMGLPIPPGFTISSKMCEIFYKNGKKLPVFLKQEILKAMEKLSQETGKHFGDTKNPLLVSVRSGAAISMPGMMDSILNLGLNDKSVQALARSHNERFAWDCYRRFIQMYADVVSSMDASLLVCVLEDLKKIKNYKKDSDLKVEDLKKLVTCFKEQILQNTGEIFPQSPQEQLLSAVSAVFSSWNNPRAISYRELNHCPHHLGTAVNVQAMVFGNKGEASATGVAFTRNPSNGEKSLMGEFLINAQGEDVVAGSTTPYPLTKTSATNGQDSPCTLEEKFPTVFKSLNTLGLKLEKHYRDVQDIEFTIEKGKLWILQTRSAKRTAKAALKVALDMWDEGLITEKELLFRVTPQALEGLLHPCLDPKAVKKKIGQGLAASPGGVSGRVAFSTEEAMQIKDQGEQAILVRTETSPEDIKGMVAALGILTARGGITSHAAVVARGMGKCCVVGCEDIQFLDEKAGVLKMRGHSLKKGDEISLDGSSGEVFLGAVPTLKPGWDKHFIRFMQIVDKYARVQVRANADHPSEAKAAKSFGAKGIGLCRTEHMFFGKERITSVRKMILASKTEQRNQALNELLPMQKQDFSLLFSIMRNLPVTIRLLDPPLHEFLPKEEKEINHLAHLMGEKPEDLKARVKTLKEFNPMLGHRGSRLAVSYPEIYRMQIQAIAQALCERKKQGETPSPEIMLPLIMMESELVFLKNLVKEEIQKTEQKWNQKIDYKLGTMIELPRAAMIADELASHVDFFSFGTNDLTQTVWGISRDDCGKFLPSYMNENILTKDPFTSLDVKGVGFLMERALHLGRKTKPGMKMGVCGEQAAEESSIYFFHKLGLDYVSCSAYRIPVARLICARANIKKK